MTRFNAYFQLSVALKNPIPTMYSILYSSQLLFLIRPSLTFVSSQGNRTNFSRARDVDSIPASRQSGDVSNSEADSSAASRFQSYDYQRASPITDTSLNSTLASDLEDAESGVTAWCFSIYSYSLLTLLKYINS